MAQGKRNRLSTEQRIEMWRRWKAGESLHDIGRAFGKGHGSIRFLLTQRGGIVPSARRRSPRTLTLAEREDISRGIAAGSTIREISSGLQRPVSTVSREVARQGGRPLYRASEADRQAWESALRPKVCLLANHEELRTIVASKLIFSLPNVKNSTLAFAGDQLMETRTKIRSGGNMEIAKERRLPHSHRTTTTDISTLQRCGHLNFAATECVGNNDAFPQPLEIASAAIPTFPPGGYGGI